MVALRLAYQNLSILIAKFDFSDAIGDFTTSARVFGSRSSFDVAYLMIRLAYPAAWCSFSEMVTDLSNELLIDNNWDHRTVTSPIRPTPIKPVCNSPSSTIGAAKEMAFVIPTPYPSL